MELKSELLVGGLLSVHVATMVYVAQKCSALD